VPSSPPVRPSVSCRTTSGQPVGTRIDGREIDG
jgi:hypothetical protein